MTGRMAGRGGRGGRWGTDGGTDGVTGEGRKGALCTLKQRKNKTFDYVRQKHFENSPTHKKRG